MLWLLPLIKGLAICNIGSIWLYSNLWDRGIDGTCCGWLRFSGTLPPEAISRMDRRWASARTSEYGVCRRVCKKLFIGTTPTLLNTPTPSLLLTWIIWPPVVGIPVPILSDSASKPFDVVMKFTLFNFLNSLISLDVWVVGEEWHISFFVDEFGNWSVFPKHWIPHILSDYKLKIIQIIYK